MRQPFGSAIGLPAHALLAHPGTTTALSAGGAGANNFAGWRQFVMAASRTRHYAFVHSAVAGLAGFPVPGLCNIDQAQPEAAARVVAENADSVLGVQVRMRGYGVARHGLASLRRAASPPAGPASGFGSAGPGGLFRALAGTRRCDTVGHMIRRTTALPMLASPATAPGGGLLASRHPDLPGRQGSALP